MKGERTAKRSSFGSLVRKRLSDITNSQSQHKLVSLEEKQQQQQPPPVSDPTGDLINQLLNEKVTLKRLLEERDKIIALSNNQMKSMKMHYQKLQMQNWNLAQSNSQMIAEVNLGREKVKALQHELVCKDALLKAKNLELAGKADVTKRTPGSQNASGERLNKANSDTKHGNHRIRRRTARSRSVGPSTTSRQCAEKEKLENKRRCLRRQSANARLEQELIENLFEIDDVTKQITQQQLENSRGEEDDTILSGSSVNSRNKAEVVQRPSLGRPLRRAAEKVQSYKEAPLNTKMRRSD